MNKNTKMEFKRRQSLPTLQTETPQPPKGPEVPRARLAETKRFDTDAIPGPESGKGSVPRQPSDTLPLPRPQVAK